MALQNVAQQTSCKEECLREIANRLCPGYVPRENASRQMRRVTNANTITGCCHQRSRCATVLRAVVVGAGVRVDPPANHQSTPSV